MAELNLIEQNLLQAMQDSNIFSEETLYFTREYFYMVDINITPAQVAEEKGILRELSAILSSIAPDAVTIEEKMSALSKSTPAQKKDFLRLLTEFFRRFINGAAFTVDSDFVVVVATNDYVIPILPKSSLVPLLKASDFLVAANKITVPINLYKDGVKKMTLTFSFQI